MTQSNLFAVEPEELATMHKVAEAFYVATRPAPDWIPRARIENPKSSKIAAAEIEETAESQCIRILAEVVKHPGCTTQELASLSGWSVHALGRRLPELRTKGLVTNPFYGEGRDAMQLRRCAIRNRLALTWRAV